MPALLCTVCGEPLLIPGPPHVCNGRPRLAAIVPTYESAPGGHTPEALNSNVPTARTEGNEADGHDTPRRTHYCCPRLLQAAGAGAGRRDGRGGPARRCPAAAPAGLAVPRTTHG